MRHITQRERRDANAAVMDAVEREALRANAGAVLGEDRTGGRVPA